MPVLPAGRFEPTRLMGWEPRGACRNMDAETFFPPDGRNGRARAAAEADARRVCNGVPAGGRMPAAPPCPVRRQCLATAFYRGEEHGTWGGLTPDDRDLLAPRGRLDEEEALALADRVLAPAGGEGGRR